jgi:hypothetical protein
LPGLIEELGEGRQRPRAGQQLVSALHLPQEGEESAAALREARHLRALDVFRAARLAGEIQQQRVVELRGALRRNHRPMDREVARRSELDQVEAAIRGEDLVLTPHRLAENVMLDLDRRLGQRVFRDEPPLEGAQRVDQAHGETRRGAETGMGGKIRRQADLDVAAKTEVAEGLAEGPVLDLVQHAHALDAAIRQPDRVVEELRLERGGAVVQVPVDGGAQHRSPVLAVKLRPVGAAAEEADAEGRLADDHEWGAEDGAAAMPPSGGAASSRRSTRSP